MDGRAIIEAKMPQVAEICRRHGVRELLLFGSALGPDFGPESDIDLLVEFDPNLSITLFDYAEVQFALEALLGRNVDLVPKKGLKPLIRSEVLSNTRTLYAA